MAVLYVTRSGAHDLDFLLHTGAAAAFRSRVSVNASLRKEIEKALGLFAQCVKGMAGDELEFCELGQLLYRLILPPAVRRELARTDEPLSLFTDDPTLPWEILHDGKGFLSLRFSFARQLILQEHLRGLLRPTVSRNETFSALVIADPTEDLPGARMEGMAVHDLFRAIAPNGSYLLLGREATWASIQRHLNRHAFSVIHYCGHIFNDAATGEPTIRLKDSELSADSVLRLFRGSPVVFLNACDSDARGSGLPPSAGLAETFAQAFMLGNEEGAASAVVGAMWLLPDEPPEAGRDLALAFYQGLLDGGPLGQSLRAARQLARDQKKWGPMVWGPYVLYGDPEYAPFLHGGVGRGAQSVEQQTGKPATEVHGPTTAARLGKEAGGGRVSFSDSSRHVLRVAVRESTRMKRGTIGTVHLLMGLCDPESRVKPLQDALTKLHLKSDVVSESVRKAAREPLLPFEEGLGVSHNFVAVLRIAALRARIFRRPGISAEDILAALLDWHSGTAIAILESHGLAARDLETTLPQIQIGPLSKRDCTPELWRLLLSAVLRAEGGQLQSIHLFRAMLREPGGATVTAFRRLGIEPDAVRGILDKRANRKSR